MAVIILSVLIILALIGLVVGGITHASRRGPITGAASALSLPPGARIISAQTDSGRLILRVKTATGEEIDILDLADGRLVSQIRTVQP